LACERQMSIIVNPPLVGRANGEDDMWDYGMHGGWIALWGLLGLVVLGTVIYIAVRLALGSLHHGHDPEDHGHSGHCC